MGLPNENFTYGVHTKPPTPIKQVINNHYGERNEKEIQKRYDDFEKSVKLCIILNSLKKNFLIQSQLILLN